MENWKRLFIKAAGFGAGFALAAAAILGAILWWSNRPVKPKPFNARAITASYSGLSIGVTGDVFHFTLTYGLRNNTDRDYELPIVGGFMIVNPENKGLDTIEGVKWDSSTIIPPGQTVNLKFEIPYQLQEYNQTGADLVPDKKEIEFAQRRMKEMGGFRFFDGTNRYEIDFPKWPVTNDTP